MTQLFSWMDEQSRTQQISALESQGYVAVRIATRFANLTGRLAVVAAVENEHVIKFIPASNFLDVKKRIEKRPGGKGQIQIVR